MFSLLLTKPKIYQNSLKQLEDVERLLSPSGVSVLIIADRLAFEESGAQRRLESLSARHEVRRFTDFTSNPRFDHALAAAEMLAADPTQPVIAIGGGSAIDTAKLACFAASNLEICRRDPVGAIATASALDGRQNPLIAIPTTAGTGSEATHFAVVYIGSQKYSLAHESLLPEAIVLDATLTHSLPPAITAATGLDALSQATESLWSIHATPDSERLAEQALQLAWANLEDAVRSPDADNRAAMLHAANLAGQAINITRTTAPHALSYHLTIEHQVPHGFAVALSVGAFLQFNAAVSEDTIVDRRSLQDVSSRLRKIAFALGGRGSLAEAAQQANTRWTALLQRIGAPTRLTDVGLTTAKQRDALASTVNAERLTNNPRRITSIELRDLVESLR